MRYASIRKMDISNGEGVGVALFVQGCHFHCKGCFNQSTWDFNGGYEWTNKTREQFYDLVRKPYIKRVSILGGEPLADENVYEVSNIMRHIKTYYPNKQIWLYTGYTWELINNKEELLLSRQRAVLCCDILLDGKFEIDKQDINNKQKIWVGSTNQRVIDVQKSLKQNKLVIYKE